MSFSRVISALISSAIAITPFFLSDTREHCGLKEKSWQFIKVKISLSTCAYLVGLAAIAYWLHWIADRATLLSGN